MLEALSVSHEVRFGNISGITFYFVTATLADGRRALGASVADFRLAELECRETVPDHLHKEFDDACALVIGKTADAILNDEDAVKPGANVTLGRPPLSPAECLELRRREEAEHSA